MKKTIAIAALAATAILGTASAANAYTVNAAGETIVAKGEVMNPLGLNEKAFQKIAMAEGESLTGSNVFTATTTTTWTCTNGDTHTHLRNTILTSPVAATEIYNGSADKVTGWTLGATGPAVISEDNTGGSRFPSYACPTGGSVNWSTMNVAQSHSDVTTFTFNKQTVTLTDTTPVEVAPAA